MSVLPSLSSLPPTPDDRLTEIGDQLLESLEALVDRNRSLRATGAAAPSDLIAAEVAQHLAVARSALSRIPRLR
ncbi:hypothetical protein [Pseudonocardia oroxyli]|uniref:Uncharacterized protein n=1 Tax=Pseudonocardia oroxyli TaxID=366584 RepID=A0A1G8C5D0_PSEOR|nr:hypothetical protein [Pseudonocardia oroxyli]SDH40584.1 hypothetical protein SAMN05216377_1224 [Pseudonocardia oroxyli]